MGFRGVWIAVARAALVLGFPALVAQGAGGDQVRAAGGGAYLPHAIPYRRRGVRHVGVPAPRKLPRGPQPDSPFSSTSGGPPHGCGADVPWWPVPLVDHAGHINHIALRAGVEPATSRLVHIVDGQLRKGNHDRLVVRSLESVPSRSSTAEPTEARRPPGKRRMASNHEKTRTRQPVATHNSRSLYTLNGERTSNKCSACRISRRAKPHQAAHPPPHATCPSQGARSHAVCRTATATRPACATHVGR